MTADLVGCPWCGKPPTRLAKRPSRKAMVGCESGESCPVEPTVFAETLGDAEKVWNTRAPVAETAEAATLLDAEAVWVAEVEIGDEWEPLRDRLQTERGAADDMLRELESFDTDERYRVVKYVRAPVREKGESDADR